MCSSTTQKNGHLLVDFLNPDVIRNDKFSSEEKELMTFILILKNVYPEILFLKKLKLRMEINNFISMKKYNYLI
ncbi:MAG: hypothetical protein CM15mP65_30210 [Crocinitomicaceae bacterium]|nr:MAG: hypothetical protein CM15mP65_30210 [Crocinitomicaceae bacterium]